MINFHGAIDRRLYDQALRRQLRGSRVLAVILLFGGLIGLFSARVIDPVTWGFPLLFMLVAVVLLISPVAAARKALKTGKVIAAPFSGGADTERLVLKSEFGTNDIPWSTFYRAVVTSDIALLFTSATQFVILSKTFFDSERDWNDFSAIVRRQVGVSPERSPWWVVAVWLAIVVIVFLVRWFVG